MKFLFYSALKKNKESHAALILATGHNNTSRTARVYTHAISAVPDHSIPEVTQANYI